MNLPPNIAAWPWKWREAFEERAAIMEFDAQLSRQQAELLAEHEIRERAAASGREKKTA